MEKDQSSNRLSNWLYIRPLEELKIFPDRSFVTRAGGAHEIREVRAGGARETDQGAREETREIRAGEARKALAGEGGVADNSVGEAREVRAEETRKVRETGEIFSSKHESVAGILIDPFVGLAVHEAVGEIVAGGSSIRLLIRVHCAPGRLEKDQSSNRLSNWLYIRPLEE